MSYSFDTIFSRMWNWCQPGIFRPSKAARTRVEAFQHNHTEHRRRCRRACLNWPSQWCAWRIESPDRHSGPPSAPRSLLLCFQRAGRLNARSNGRVRDHLALQITAVGRSDRAAHLSLAQGWDSADRSNNECQATCKRGCVPGLAIACCPTGQVLPSELDGHQ
jgi:hypothetical protein